MTLLQDILSYGSIAYVLASERQSRRRSRPKSTAKDKQVHGLDAATRPCACSGAFLAWMLRDLLQGHGLRSAATLRQAAMRS
jgi:hypothetical protein